jgi:hypothetical protein
MNIIKRLKDMLKIARGTHFPTAYGKRKGRRGPRKSVTIAAKGTQGFCEFNHFDCRYADNVNDYGKGCVLQEHEDCPYIKGNPAIPQPTSDSGDGYAGPQGGSDG